MNEIVKIKAVKLKEMFREIFSSLPVDERAAFHVVEGLVQTSLRGVDSHGIRLFPHYIRALKAGRINGKPNYQFDQSAPSVGRLDADHTFGHASGAEGMNHAIEMATQTGIGAVSVYNSTHFGAAAYYGLMASDRDMIGISCTHADALMLSANGTRSFFGTNPICFTTPVKDEEPFCLDMATSTTTWNKVKIHRESDQPLPEGFGADAKGNTTTNPHDMTSLFPIGDYKGFGLSMVIDILCAMISGMPFGREIAPMYTTPLEQKRFLGHFFIAMDVSKFIELNAFKTRMKESMDAIRREPARDSEKPVLVPGDPEKQMVQQRMKEGIPMTTAEHEDLLALLNEQGVTS